MARWTMSVRIGRQVQIRHSRRPTLSSSWARCSLMQAGSKTFTWTSSTAARLSWTWAPGLKSARRQTPSANVSRCCSTTVTTATLRRCRRSTSTSTITRAAMTKKRQTTSSRATWCTNCARRTAIGSEWLLVSLAARIRRGTTRTSPSGMNKPNGVCPLCTLHLCPLRSVCFRTTGDTPCVTTGGWHIQRSTNPTLVRYCRTVARSHTGGPLLVRS
mmetsp:Transcript_8770/g.21073  ORF Transcript_8770/g.21073 Transcript_8770/m.21073 type:complete len:216 (+) Transcript_8770:19-666(+)